MRKFFSHKSATFLLAALLSLSIPAGFSNDSFAVEYTFKAVLLKDQLVIEGTTLQEIPGEPLIPVYSARILLPQDAKVEDVMVTSGTPVVQEGIDIPWGQPPVTFSNPEAAEKVDRNEEIYNSDEWYPNIEYRVVSTESFRGFQILYVALYPLQYQLKSRTVKFCEKMTVEVKFDEGERNKLYRGLEDDRKAVVSMVDNPEMVAAYSEPITEPTQLTGGPYKYIIITDSTLTPAFYKLLVHKIDYAGRCKIVDVEWIYDSYDGYDNPEKIRNFIIDAYIDWETTFCLLGGDIAVVPYRGFYVSIENGPNDFDMAADMYFGCLDGDFDRNGNHIYGEPDDKGDLIEEVFIGRAPVETVEEADIFVNKVIEYEFAIKPKVCQFHQARARYDNDPDTIQIAQDCERWVPLDYIVKKLFEEDGHISHEDWKMAWDGSYDGEPHTPPLTFQHTGHGATTYYNICYEVGGSTNWGNSDVPTLANTFWPIHMSVACHSGNFKHNDCLAETYVKDDCGAIACMFNVNSGWYSRYDASKYSGEFLETMFRALFSDGSPLCTADSVNTRTCQEILDFLLFPFFKSQLFYLSGDFLVEVLKVQRN